MLIKYFIKKATKKLLVYQVTSNNCYVHSYLVSFVLNFHLLAFTVSSILFKSLSPVRISISLYPIYTPFIKATMCPLFFLVSLSLYNIF